jgi:Protein of unknown function (DUF3105)
VRRVPKVGWIAAGVVAVGAVAAAVVVLTRGSASVADTMRAAGCTYQDAVPYPPKDWKTLADYHADVPTLSSPVRWKTFPPSGGSHYRLWATWGFYTKPVNPRQVVHNEEHGGVVLWWGPKVPASTVAELRAFYDSQPVAVFGTPLAGLGDRVAISAWTADPSFKGDLGLSYRQGNYGIGHVAVCPRFDEHAFAVFRDAYRGHSPQGFPIAADAPGCGPTTSCKG